MKLINVSHRSVYYNLLQKSVFTKKTFTKILEENECRVFVSDFLHFGKFPNETKYQ
jgi:hypothetical protein